MASQLLFLFTQITTGFPFAFYTNYIKNIFCLSRTLKCLIKYLNQKDIAIKIKKQYFNIGIRVTYCQVLLIDQAPMTKKVPHRTPQNYKVKMAEKHVRNMLLITPR